MNMRLMEPVKGSQFITITLPPSAYKFKAAEQHSKIKQILIDTFTAHCDQYCLVAELTQQSNVHYHGWFTEKYERSTLFLLDHLKQRYLGIVKVNDRRIMNIKRTYDYMTKDMEITKKLVSGIVISNNYRIPKPPNLKIKITDLEQINKLEKKPIE